ncbi:MAG TPA: GspH/FimT family protein [Steroidobacteraceae bacterium]|jgi:type IV fimbrial biogenesis protein FimT|nr:GspH/FimT family protein [Steroidobacteraceae bacterium]
MAGVTLVELLVVLTIAGILLGIGTSSYKSITTSYRISGEINGLLGDMQYARSEAIKQGQNVVVCVANSAGSDCAAADTRWQDGWIVFANTTGASPPTTSGNAALVMRVQPAFTAAGTGSSDTLTDGVTSYVTFDREGLALGLLTTRSGLGGAVITLHDSTSNATRTRCLQVTNVGNVSVQQPSTLSSCT